MNPSVKQLRDAIGEIDSETGIAICVSGKREYVFDGKEIIINVLAECEKLDQYKNAGEALADAIEKNGCGEEGSGCSYCYALITYRQAVEQKEV